MSRLKRLRDRAQFQAVTGSPPVVKTAHFALHMSALDTQADGVRLFPSNEAWLGVLIPKRWARHAVTRNAIRRQIYACAAALQPPLPSRAWVVRLRNAFPRGPGAHQFHSATSPAFKRHVRQELDQLLGRVHG